MTRRVVMSTFRVTNSRLAVCVARDAEGLPASCLRQNRDLSAPKNGGGKLHMTFLQGGSD